MSQLLTVEEVAQLLGVKVSTVRAWIAQKRLRKVKLGRAVRIPADFIQQFIQCHTHFESGKEASYDQ